MVLFVFFLPRKFQRTKRFFAAGTGDAGDGGFRNIGAGGDITFLAAIEEAPAPLAEDAFRATG